MTDEVRLLRAQSQDARAAGRLDEALDRQAAAVTLLREGDDRAALAHALRHVADVLRASGDAPAAAGVIAEMLALYRALPDAHPLDIANAIRSAALQADAIGEPDAALWREARDRYDATGIGPGVSEAETRLAALIA